MYFSFISMILGCTTDLLIEATYFNWLEIKPECYGHTKQSKLLGKIFFSYQENKFKL